MNIIIIILAAITIGAVAFFVMKKKDPATPSPTPEPTPEEIYNESVMVKPPGGEEKF